MHQQSCKLGRGLMWCCTGYIIIIARKIQIYIFKPCNHMTSAFVTCSLLCSPHTLHATLISTDTVCKSSPSPLPHTHTHTCTPPLPLPSQWGSLPAPLHSSIGRTPAAWPLQILQNLATPPLPPLECPLGPPS